MSDKPIPPVPGPRPVPPGPRPQPPGPSAQSKAPVLGPSAQGKTGHKDGNTIRFDWYPNSVSQVVALIDGEKRVEAIIGSVITAGTDPGPASLVFRKVPKGIPLTEGKPLHTGSIDLIGTGLKADHKDQDQTLEMVDDTNLEEGDCIAADFFGNMSNARGTVMIKVVDR